MFPRHGVWEDMCKLLSDPVDSMRSKLWNPPSLPSQLTVSGCAAQVVQLAGNNYTWQAKGSVNLKSKSAMKQGWRNSNAQTLHQNYNYEQMDKFSGHSSREQSKSLAYLIDNRAS